MNWIIGLIVLWLIIRFFSVRGKPIETDLESFGKAANEDYESDPFEGHKRFLQQLQNKIFVIKGIVTDVGEINIAELDEDELAELAEINNGKLEGKYLSMSAIFSTRRHVSSIGSRFIFPPSSSELNNVNKEDVVKVEGILSGSFRNLPIEGFIGVFIFTHCRILAVDDKNSNKKR